MCLDPIGIHVGRKRNDPAERPEASFHPLRSLFFVLRLVLLLAANREDVLSECDLDILVIHPGQLDLDPDLLIRLPRVERGKEATVVA